YSIGYSFSAGYEDLGPLGVLFLDRFHSSFSVLYNGTTSSLGIGYFSAQIPASSNLVGRNVSIQALSGFPIDRRLSNASFVTIQP
ncbi:MAG: hypothetical protein MK213_06110, partial [Planctomycetes bacterium]|nr:hypothetical protein [Planctomycetota bacterium]